MKRLADDATMRKEPGWKAQARATVWSNLTRTLSLSPSLSLTRRRAARTARRASPLPPTSGRRAAVRAHVEMHGGCAKRAAANGLRHGGCRGWWAARGGWACVGWPGPCGSRGGAAARPTGHAPANPPRRTAHPRSWSAPAPGARAAATLLRCSAAPLLLCSSAPLLSPRPSHRAPPHRAPFPPQAADAKSADGRARRGGFSRVARGEPRPAVNGNGGGGAGLRSPEMIISRDDHVEISACTHDDRATQIRSARSRAPVRERPPSPPLAQHRCHTPPTHTHTPASDHDHAHTQPHRHTPPPSLACYAVSDGCGGWALLSWLRI